MDKFIWASPHKPTSQQLAELKAKGEVVFLSETNHDLFNLMCNIQKNTDLTALAVELATSLMKGDTLVQPAGNPKLHMTLGRVMITLSKSNDVIFAFSKRVSVDEEQADGTVLKRVVFTHEGFI